MISYQARQRIRELFEFISDILIVLIKSIWFILETLLKTIIPEKYLKLKDVAGEVVLITGGGGGVGRLLALNLAQLNAVIVIWDINQEAIQSTISLLAQHGYCSVKGYVVNISDREEVYSCAAKTTSEVGNVNILINNAGIVCCKPFWDLPDRAIQSTYNVNILSHYWTVKAFLPHMMEHNRGHIVTIGSLTGMMGTYGCTDYSATKFACIGFHESLLTDLKTHGYDNIDLTLICPYYINTSMFSGVRPRMLPMLEPQYVAKKIVSAIRKKEMWCILPNALRFVTPLKCLLPAKMCWALMSRVVRAPDSMMMFEGQKRVPEKKNKKFNGQIARQCRDHGSVLNSKFLRNIRS